MFATRCRPRAVLDQPDGLARSAERWPRPPDSPAARVPPWIRRYPHRGFSRPSRSTSSCTCPLTGGRPGRFGYRHLRATRRRCQANSVPGETIRDILTCPGNSRASATSIARSDHVSRGRPTCRRNTATSCRNTSSSATTAASRRVSTPTNRTAEPRSDTEAEDTQPAIMPHPDHPTKPQVNTPNQVLTRYRLHRPQLHQLSEHHV
jgi:hypothetical protein